MRLTLLVAAFVAVQVAPAAAADRVVFASARTGVSQVYSLDLATGGVAQLTFGASDACDPAPSPDGRFIAWVECDAPGPLWVARADGAQARRVADHAAAPAWRPDSRRLTWWSLAGIVSAKPGGSGRRIVVAHEPGAVLSAPRWSPDGRRLLVARHGDLLVVGGGTRIAVAGEVRRLAAWSPDGRTIAFRTRGAVELVRPDGTRRQTLLTGLPDYPPGPVGLAWSPDGRRLAIVWGGELRVVDVRSGAAAPPLTTARASAVWTRDGRSLLAPVDAGGIVRVFLDGRTATLIDAEFAQVEGLVALRARGGLRYRPLEPLEPIAHVAGNELRAKVAIRRLAADGPNAAFSLCGTLVAVWQPDGLKSATPLDPAACRRADPYKWTRKLTLARTRLLHLYGSGNTVQTVWLDLASVGGAPKTIARGFGTLGHPWTPPFGYPLGDGDDLVYSTWEGCARDCGDIGSVSGNVVSQAIFRMDWSGPVVIAHRRGPAEPLSLDRGRLVVRTTTGLELFDLTGTTLLTLPISDVAAVALAGDDLTILRRGELRHYDARNGALLHIWPLPDLVPGGVCPRLYCWPTPELILEDAAMGLVVYRIGGNVHLLRLADGADRVVANDATEVELEDEGLYYAFTGEAPYPGRIRFVPTAELSFR